MCGILGMLNADGREMDRDRLLAMAATLAHRGPDGEGAYVDGPAALAHRRLSIIDLGGGGQPMSNEDGTVWIVFNGEIYNFPALRRELEDRGHRFRTRSDTEVIVHAYEEYGEDCVKKLRGMFAFGIWDARRQRWFLARDRLGKKPLYYYHDGRRFVFASEIKAILRDRSVPREIDPTALRDYFTYGYIPFPKTIFRSIRKLPPAHRMRVARPAEASGRVDLRTEAYWDLEYAPDRTLSETDWIEGLREKLLEAVRVRLLSDVPLGAFLSGGIDSSAVVAMMSRLMDQPVKTFSIGFEESDFSELEYARRVAERFGTQHHETIVRPDAIALLPKLAWAFDEPFADSSAIPTYYVSRMAREQVTVVLSGDGGDETFAGYRRYLWATGLSRWDFLPGRLRETLFGWPAALMPEGLRGKGALRNMSLGPFERYRCLITQDAARCLPYLLSEDLQRAMGDAEPSGSDFLAPYYHRHPEADYLSKLQYLDTKTYLPEDILTKVDRASMLCSLETRAPLLDHELLEFVARMPSHLKLKKGETKYILKKAMEGILPPEILHRPKMGFAVPLVHWFKGDLVEVARDLLLSPRCRQRGYVNTRFVERLLADHQKKARDHSLRIWELLFFEQWCRNWLDASDAEPAAWDHPPVRRSEILVR